MSAIIVLLLTAVAAQGLLRLKVDDSLSELFRTNTPEFRTYEEIDRRFPSSEYDVLVVVEGKSLLTRDGLTAFAAAAADLQLADGVNGIVSMLSARGKPDATGYAPPIVPDDLPEDAAAFDKVLDALKTNDIVKGKFLSEDGQLALIVLSLNRDEVAEKSAKVVISGIEATAKQDLGPAGLSVKLAGAPVMQLEIRNAVERDQLVYNGLGLFFGAGIAALFFRRISLMLVAALPPVIAVAWSLGLLGWLNFKLNLFLNVMTPLIMVMGFADSMQMVSAIRIRTPRGRHQARGRQVRDQRRRPGVRACSRRDTSVIPCLAVLGIGPHPHIRPSWRHVGLHLVLRRDHRAADPRVAVHSQREDARPRPHSC